jgi:hypothetical protein
MRKPWLTAVLKGGDSEVPALVAGKPGESPLYLAALRTHDDWEPMPPKEADRLSAEQIGWIKGWIAGGAPWPDESKQKEIAKSNEARWSADDGIRVKTTGALSPEWADRKYNPEALWGYSPVKRPAMRGLPDENPVDSLIAAGVTAKSCKQA